MMNVSPFEIERLAKFLEILEAEEGTEAEKSTESVEQTESMERTE